MDKGVLKSSHILQKITEKRNELESLNEIKKFSAMLNSQLEELEDKMNCMAEGTESVALVLSNWQNVVRSVSLASLGLLKYTAKEKDEKTTMPMPECLVRIRLDSEDAKEETLQSGEKESIENSDFEKETSDQEEELD